MGRDTREIIVRPPDELTRAGLDVIPAVVAAEGKKAQRRFFEFFAAQIRNPHTRRAYHRVTLEFFTWCERRRLGLLDIEPVHVAAYIEDLLRRDYAKPTVKQQLAAVRMLFDWLVVGQVVPTNPATSVRGPKHVVAKGLTPVLSTEEARTLLDGINVSSIVGLRDRALIGVLLYAFARIDATVKMKVKDYFPQGKRWWFRLHEKNGKLHQMPVHHKAEEFMDAYLAEAGIDDDKSGPLFRSARGKTKTLTRRALSQSAVYQMLQRRAAQVGIETHICCHSFRATGITNYLENGGTLENAQAMAAHSSPRTTKLYDRTSDEITLDEIERIAI